MKYPETMRLDVASQCFMSLSKALETGEGLIGLPEAISFEVIKIK